MIPDLGAPQGMHQTPGVGVDWDTLGQLAEQQAQKHLRSSGSAVLMCMPRPGTLAHFVCSCFLFPPVGRNIAKTQSGFYRALPEGAGWGHSGCSQRWTGG